MIHTAVIGQELLEKAQESRSLLEGYLEAYKRRLFDFLLENNVFAYLDFEKFMEHSDVNDYELSVVDSTPEQFFFYVFDETKKNFGDSLIIPAEYLEDAQKWETSLLETVANDLLIVNAALVKDFGDALPRVSSIGPFKHKNLPNDELIQVNVYVGSGKSEMILTEKYEGLHTLIVVRKECKSYPMARFFYTISV